MTTALILGGASGVWADAEAALNLFTPDLVIAVNDIGTQWAGRLTHWITLHPEHMERWRRERMERGLKAAERHVGHKLADGVDEGKAFLLPGQKISGGSGLFAVKVAIDEGCGRIILAGVPMTEKAAHFFTDKPWRDCHGFIEGWWQAMPSIERVTRSMSGWTQDMLGEPTQAWLAGSPVLSGAPGQMPHHQRSDEQRTT